MRGTVAFLYAHRVQKGRIEQRTKPAEISIVFFSISKNRHLWILLTRNFMRNNFVKHHFSRNIHFSDQKFDFLTPKHKICFNVKANSTSGTEAPEGSVTLPEIVALKLCDTSDTGTERSKMKRIKPKGKYRLVIEISF